MSEHPKESDMSAQVTKAAETKTVAEIKPDLAANYRPLGIKAVLAASLMSRRSAVPSRA